MSSGQFCARPGLALWVARSIVENVLRPQISKVRSLPGRVVRRGRKFLLQRKAQRYRKKLGQVSDVQWIAITGSCGKSTTARLLAQILGKQGDCPLPNERWNYTGTVPLAILNVKPTQDYVVQEVGTHVPGTIRRLCEMLQPQIGVVMNVGTDHYSLFKSVENIANEKADLVRALPADGIAVINADDPNVVTMANESKARVVTFGIENAADFRAEAVRSSWPEPLSFTLVHDGERIPVTTQLHGKHLAPNVLASLATAHAAGVPLLGGVEAARDVEPVSGRMSELKALDGVTFIRDDFKAPWWGIPLALDFLSDARAARKIAVMGEMSDNPGNKGRKFRRFVNLAVESADLVLVVGEAVGALNQQLKNSEKVKAISTVAGAHRFLQESLQGGDLVLLKGMLADHFERLAWARTGDVGCWRSRCGRNIQCSSCELLAAAAEPEDDLP